MIAEELPLARRHRLSLAVLGASANAVRIEPGTECELFQDGRSGAAVLRCGDAVWSVEPSDDVSAEALRGTLERRRPAVSWVSGFLQDGSSLRLLVDLAEYPDGLVTPDVMEIGVDDRVVSDVGERFLHEKSTRGRVLDWLADEMLLQSRDGSAYLILSNAPGLTGGNRAAFRVFGRTVAIDVQTNLDGRLSVERVVRRVSGRDDSERGRTVLLRAPLRFVDLSTAARFGGAMQESLDQLVAGGASYLEYWSEYNRIEERLLLRRARKMGWLSYTGRESLGAGRWRFFAPPDEDFESWSFRARDEDDVQIEAAARVPEELLADPSDPVSDEDESNPFRQNRGGPRRVSGRMVAANAGRRSVDIQLPGDEDDERVPAVKGVLFLSLVGSQRVVQRRRDAERRIVRGEAPMGMRLRALLEDVPVPELRIRHEQPLTPAARGALGGSPTDRQREALDIALNTPDIALIQGPPGTGKTAVIAALQARIAELAEHRHTVSGRMLLSSVQHDAVDHAAARTEVFGLPPVKVGKRWGQESAVDERVKRWAEERVDAISADLATRAESTRWRDLRHAQALLDGYIASPGDTAETALLLRRVATLLEPHLAAKYGDAVREHAVRLDSRRAMAASSGEGDGRELMERAVRAIRVDAGTFADDGPVMARRALLRLSPSSVARQEDLALLERAGAWDTEAEPPFLAELREVRDRCLDALASDQAAAAQRVVDEGALEVMSAAIDAMRSEVAGSSDGVADVLAEFAHDLRSDPVGVARMLNEYTAVLAATCQQAASDKMAKAKALAGGSGDHEGDRTTSIGFETVIIDEAARANPLDLLIPMAMGERRIVLVGDHRQLPHMLEPEVERELGASLQEEARAAIRTSLFERLFLAMKRRQATDGVCRTVTLDTQFRMHPTLGDFVSRTFYERHDPSAIIKAGRPASEFVHDLPGAEGAVAAWIDVPLARGAESSGQSKSRAIEARTTAEWVKRFADHRPDFSIGVVSFYAAQIAELKRAFVKAGLAQTSEGGDIDLLGEYRETRGADGRRTERLRIGTVDALQGREFDVVFLSLTRSNSVVSTDENSRRRKYGFLMLENRLCVAMSRQQRLLVVVGDGAMAEGAAAAEAVPALAAFRDLCRGPEGKIID